NVGGSADGFSFGLINIVPGGRVDLEGAIDSNSTGTLLFRHGGNRWHNVYGIGGHPVDTHGGANDDVWMYGLGFGPSWRVAHTRVDLEAIGWEVNHGARQSTDISILGQLRLPLALGVGSTKCGFLNAHDDRFCGGCGRSHRAAAPVQRTIPIDLTELISETKA